MRTHSSLSWGPMKALRLVVAFLLAFVWLAAGIYMHSYMRYEEHVSTFYTYYLITLGATQGIFLAGNFIVLLIFLSRVIW